MWIRGQTGSAGVIESLIVHARICALLPASRLLFLTLLGFFFLLLSCYLISLLVSCPVKSVQHGVAVYSYTVPSTGPSSVFAYARTFDPLIKHAQQRAMSFSMLYYP